MLVHPWDAATDLDSRSCTQRFVPDHPVWHLAEETPRVEPAVVHDDACIPSTWPVPPDAARAGVRRLDTSRTAPT